MKLYKATVKRESRVGPQVDETYIVAENISEAANQVADATCVELISEKLIVKTDMIID